MGVIRRQSFKTSVIGYIGVVIGTLSTMFIYPDALEIIGLFRSLFDASVLLGIFVLLGTSLSAVRFFPRYENKETGHSGLLTWLLIVTGIGFVALLILFPFIRQWLSDFIFHERNRKYEEFIYYVIPLTLFVSLINLLSRYISNFRLITIPSALEQLTIKITLPLIIIAFLNNWLTVEGVLFCVMVSFAMASAGLILYMMYLGEWRLTKPVIVKDKAALKEFYQYSWFGLLAGIGSQIAFRIDGLMVAAKITFEATGVYAIAWAISEIITKPMRSISNISGPMLAKHIERNEIDEVRNLYEKSSLTMTIVGLGLFLGIWTILPYIFEVMSNTQRVSDGLYVVFFLGLAQVWDMMTGVNNEIILYSKHYRFTLYLTLMLAIVTVVSNIYFIDLYGLVGAGMATCLSLFLYNIAKLIFIKVKMGIQPFTAGIIPVVGLGVGAWLISKWIPDTPWTLVSLVIKGGVFSSLFGWSVYRFRISPDINQWVDLIWEKGKALLQRIF